MLGSYQDWGITVDFGLLTLKANKSKSYNQIETNKIYLKRGHQNTYVRSTPTLASFPLAASEIKENREFF